MLRGQKRPITKVPQVKQDVRASIHNRFDVEVVDAVTGEIKQKAYAENIVLNALWTRLLAPNNYFNYIHYGTGTGTLVATRTSLFTFLGAKAAGEKTLTYDWDNGWISSRKKIQIAPEEHVGSEFKEVGIGYSATAANLVTHALLKDMNGNTITIVKTATDVINIYATVFVHWDVAGYGGAKVYEKEINEIISIFLVGDMLSGQAVIDSITVSTGGNPLSRSSGYRYDRYSVTPSFNASAKTISVSKRLGVNDANYPIRRITANAYSNAPSVVCDVGGAWFAGVSISGEALGTGDGTKTAFKTTHGWIKPGAKVYVNGVEQTSGVTVTTGLPNVKTNFGSMLEFVSGSGGTVAALAYLHPEMTGVDHPGVLMSKIYYNPFFVYGLASVKVAYMGVHMSDDGVNWGSEVALGGSSLGQKSIAAEHRTKKYIRISNTSTSNTRVCEFTADTLPEND